MLQQTSSNIFLNNSFPCKIAIRDLRFRCAEAAFQAIKFYPDKKTMKLFQYLDGKAAFTLGEDLSNKWTQAQRNNWDSHKAFEMYKVVRAKFVQNEDLRKLLLATGNAYLVEHTPLDRREGFWGDNSDGTGENWLGRIAMLARAAINGAEVPDRPEKYNQFILSRQK